MNPDRAVFWLRVTILACIAVLFMAAISVAIPAAVKAPLLTMMGGATIITALYPPEEITIQGVGTLVGTFILLGSVDI